MRARWLVCLLSIVMPMSASAAGELAAQNAKLLEHIDFGGLRIMSAASCMNMMVAGPPAHL